MEVFNDLTIDQVIERQCELFVRVPVKIDPLSRPNQCYQNCVTKVERDGGRVIVGWRKTCATVGAELIATLDHHAVWESPAGELVDISARVRIFNKREEIIVDKYIDFMAASAAKFDNPE